MGIASAFLLPPSLSELRRTQSLSELRRTRSLFELRRTSRSTHPARYALKTAPPFLGFSKFEFNGIGGLRAHIGIVPICGTSLPVHFGPGLPWLGPFLFWISRSQRGAHSAQGGHTPERRGLPGKDAIWLTQAGRAATSPLLDRPSGVLP